MGRLSQITPREAPRFAPCLPCGADRTRTDDFLLAKQALYQLSYIPKRGSFFGSARDSPCPR